jgi:hypothetical protein
VAGCGKWPAQRIGADLLDEHEPPAAADSRAGINPHEAQGTSGDDDTREAVCGSMMDRRVKDQVV